MMNHRLTAAAALATVCASFSLFAVLNGATWMEEGIAAIVLIALAGTLTRSATAPAAIGATIAVLIASVPLLVGAGWAGVIGALVLVALAALSATGNRSARAFAMLATYCSFLLVYLNAVFAGAHSYAWVIPSPASMAALWRLPSLASPQFQSSPPILATKPVDLVAVAGIGAIAIIVDYMAVRLRRPALAGLPLLLLFSVPVASNLKGFSFGQSISFALAIAGYLTLLSTDGRQRLRMWGRLVTVRRITGEDGGAGPDTRDLAATGRRVGLAAICLAIAIPIALPTSKPHDIFSTGGGGGAGGTGGPSSSDDTSPLSNVQHDLTEGKALPVLSYTTTAPHPQEQYLADWVMNYDQASQSWEVVNNNSLPVQDGKMPFQVPGLQAGTPTSIVKTTLSIGYQQAQTPVPVPYAPLRVAGSGAEQMSEESGTLTVIDNDQQKGMRLTVTSEVATPTSEELNDDYQAVPGSILSTYGGYRGPYAVELRTIADDETAGAGGNPFEEAYDLQSWFHSSDFAYSLKPPLGSNWLPQFLTRDRRGDCAQFSVAFAVLARTLGIASRIVVGFTAGTPGANGTWQVTTADAHAWPELFFAGVGWVRFEPTPGGPTGQGTAETPAYATNFRGAAPPPSTTKPGGTTVPPPGKPPAGSAAKGCHGLRVSFCKNPGGAGSSALNSAASHGFPVGIPIAVVAVLLLASPALARWLTRRRRWMTASGDAGLALAAWSELHDDLSDYGIDTLPSDSPRMTVGRVADAARLRPAPREALARVASAVERAQYSLGTLPGARLRADVAAVRRAVASHATKPQRLRAVLLPPSTLAAVANALQSAGRATSWIDWSWPTMRQQFRRTVLRRAG
jgi:transglutaminase-like putative cysteine protease